MASRDFSEIAAQFSSESAPSNQQVLLSVIQAIGANNFAEVPQYLTDDAELHIHGFPHMNGSWRGRTNVMAAMQMNFNKVTEQKPIPQAIVQHGDVIVARLHETGRFRQSKIPYEVDVVIWCTFAGGKIAKIEEFVHYTNTVPTI